MCGIYGFIGKVKPKHRKKMVELLMELGAQTEIRGTDATGFYAKDNEFEYMEKHCVPASTFYLESEMFTEAIMNGAFVFIGHNRAASVGSIKNDNAHPFLGEKIAMVHNGTCSHAKNLLNKAERTKMEGDTDSEAIMHYLEREGLSTRKYANLSNFSIVAFDRVSNKLYFARDEYKPMVILDLRKQLGVRVFASTVSIAKEALSKCKIAWDTHKVFSTMSYHVYEANPEDGEVKRLFDFSLQQKPKPVKENKYFSHTTPVKKEDSTYQTPSYLSYLKRGGGYHFAKPEAAKSLLSRAMAVFGD